MTESRRHQLLRNTFVSLGTWLLPIVPSLIATPILIRRLGTENYGLYIGIVSVISYFFTGGMGRVAAKYVAEYSGSEKENRISQLVSATIILSQGLGLIGVMTIVLGAHYLVVTVLRIPPAQEGQAVTALYLACAVLLATTLGQIFQFALQGIDRFGRVFVIASVSGALLNFGSIAVVVLGYGVTGLVAWMLGVNTLTAVAFYVYARKLIPALRFTFQIDRASWNDVATYSLSLIFHQIFGNALFLFERGWVLRKFGSEVLAFYAVAMTLAMYIQLFASNLVFASFPAINRLLSEPEKLVKLYQKSTKYVLAFVVFSMVSMLVAGKAFLSLWVGPEFAASAAAFLSIHSLTFGIVALNTVIWQINESYRAAMVNSFATFLWMAVSVPLMIFLSDDMSTSGVAAARLVGVLIFIPFLFWSEARFLGGQVRAVWLPSGWRIAFSALAAGVTEWGILTIVGVNWLGLIATGAAGCVVYVGILIICRTFDEEEKQFFVSLVNRKSSVHEISL